MTTIGLRERATRELRRKITANLLERAAMSETTATLQIDTSFSRCSACGGNATPNEDHHIHGGRGGMTLSEGALSKRGGCGARFEEYVEYGRPITAERLAAIRAMYEED